MIAAVVIASVVAYTMVGGVTYGFFAERWKTAPYLGNGDAAWAATFWPLTLIVFGLAKTLPRVLRLPVVAGRRLATPKPQLPEARVIRGDDTGRGT